jgi:hypothetical protein
LSIDADGNLTLAPIQFQGPIAHYQLCEAGADPVNCTNATATVVVLNPIDAVDDNPCSKHRSKSKSRFNVTDNDTLNTVLVSPTNTNVTPVSAGPLSIDSNGVVTLAGNTPREVIVLPMNCVKLTINRIGCTPAIVIALSLQ